MSVIPQKKPCAILNKYSKGFHDLSTQFREKVGVKNYTNFWTPCILLSLPNSAWAGGNLAGGAEQLGTDGGIPKFWSTKHGLRPAA